MFGGAGAPPSQPAYGTRDFPSEPEFPMPMPGAGFGAASTPFIPLGAPPMVPQMGSSYSPWGFDTAVPPPPPPSAPPAMMAGPRGPEPMQAMYSSHSHHHHHHHIQSASHVYESTAPRPHSYVEAQALQNTSPHFQYSKCTGKRKAVCVGINYYRQAYELYGCVNDAKNVYRFLNKHHNYREEDIVLLVDDSRNPRQQPTRKNIVEAMRWLVRDAQPNDSLFFHYSGHGGQVKDRDGDEIDGWDEVIYPLDYQKAGSIVDDLMHALMVKPLPTGCRLTALFDSCHSGSILDLPYLYHTNGRTKGSQVKRGHIKEKSTPADVISWSGCKDSQKSADTFEGGAAAGAMSYAFMTSLTLDPHQTYQELLRSVRDILKSKYSQKPQLSSSHRIDTNLQFLL